MARQTNINIRRVKCAVGLSFIVAATMIVAFATTNASAQVYPSGMVAYWKFDETSGTTAYDALGGNNGQLVSSPVWTTGKVGGALSFDGLDDYVNAGTGTNLDFTDAITIEAWVKRGGSGGDMQTIAGKYDVSTDHGYHVFFSGLLWPGNENAFTFTNQHVANYLGATKITDTTNWHHLVATYDRVNVNLYVDGVIDKTYPAKEAITSAAGYPFWIGARNGAAGHFGSPWYFFKGVIDELAIYNRSLTAEEIQQHYQNGLNGLGYELVTLKAIITSPSSGFVESVEVPILFTGDIIEPDAGDTHEAVWTINNENGTEDRSATVTDLSISDEFTFYDAGIYSIKLTVTDSHGESDETTVVNDNPESPAFIVIYDPSGGFVTGGGWINSPAGAYKPDTSLAGKANFGFVSKYQKGATIPTGNTEFVFKAGDLNFHSTSYEWLVVTGSNYARYKGSGTINGLGNYKFMLWAGDNTPDTFRIRIWEEDESTGIETDIYDNGDDQAIEGGSIIVHTK